MNSNNLNNIDNSTRDGLQAIYRHILDRNEEWPGDAGAKRMALRIQWLGGLANADDPIPNKGHQCPATRAAREHGNLAYLEWVMNQSLLKVRCSHLVFHAAAASLGSKCVLLAGHSGCGKTALVGGLVRRGLGYLGDEVISVDKKNCWAYPFPKALSIKRGAFELFNDVESCADFDGPREEIRYLDPERLRAGSVIKHPTPIGWIVFPRYERGCDARLERLTVGERLLGLFENTVNIHRHKEAGLDRLMAIANRVPGYRLIFGDLEHACKLIIQIGKTTPIPCN